MFSICLELDRDVDSNSIILAPIRKPPAPIAIMAIEKNCSFRLVGSGVEKAGVAAAINARHSSKFENTIRHERSLKFQFKSCLPPMENSRGRRAYARTSPQSLRFEDTHPCRSYFYPYTRPSIYGFLVPPRFGKKLRGFAASFRRASVRRG